jgi:D-alanine-D-alanine ligase
VLRELGHEVFVLPLGEELRPIRDAIDAHRPHVAVNLLRHFHGVPGYDAHVVSYLELLRIPYTGVNPRGLLIASDKPLAKKILTYHRIRVPDFMVARAGRRFRGAKKGLAFPLIVKTAGEHASTGIAQASIVHDDEALRERVEFVHRSIGPEALIEEYIPGRELTIGMVGNDRVTTFPIWEMVFERLRAGNEPIATHRVKWDLAYQEKVGVRTGKAKDLPDGLEESLPRLARRIHRALQLSGYARVDIRLRDDGVPFVLEANPNPDLCYGEDFAEAAFAAGMDYPELVQRILNLGMAYQPPWKQY